jgi:CelD/BcsL family acetyltransferase involved in cellulose biosynthesis
MSTRAMFEGRIVDALGANPDAHLEAPAAALPGVRPPHLELSLYHDLDSIENDWRAFEESADCTVFQTFDWLSTWFRNIGVHDGVKPVVVIGRHGGTTLFLLPFALETNGFVRKITWLGSWLNNYNGPLVASDFSRRVSALQFVEVWREIHQLLRRELHHDLIDLEKMPKVLGGQANPFGALRVTPHVNDAYLATLGGDWETYYATKRSSATRKTDRKKRKRLADHGETRFITAGDRDDVVKTVDALIEEKRKSYAKLGVANMFKRPGYRDFFLDLATAPRSTQLAHVSRLDVGDATAAANFGLTFRGRYYYILAGYDDGELARFGPGAIQLMDVMRYAIEHGCKLFDFTIGDEPYKREWCDVEIGLCDYIAPASFRGWILVISTIAARAIKRRIKRSPAAWAVIRKVRMLMGSLRG